MMFERSLPIFGEEGIKRLGNSAVLVFGAGGVGCAVIEALCRAGVGHIAVCDGDVYSESNLNRQLYATHRTLGQSKARVACERITSIAPFIKTECFDFFYRSDDMARIDLSKYDYIADCIDDVKAKCDLIEKSVGLGVPVISCMGTGNKLDPFMFRIDDIKKTTVCPLAKAVRVELRKRGIISGVNVLYSLELPSVRRPVPSSVSFVPPVAGYMMASRIIKDIAFKQANDMQIDIKDKDREDD